MRFWLKLNGIYKVKFWLKQNGIYKVKFWLKLNGIYKVKFWLKLNGIYKVKFWLKQKGIYKQSKVLTKTEGLTDIHCSRQYFKCVVHSFIKDIFCII